ncbi:MAG: peptidoglycan DD-metalloendopeptidase family protein, partial [Solirubrobacterales bacterium]|nr:peptidoglycan DD-metalloendopeptidase family protein [Solirubrobacterales bacterium]
MARPSDLDPYPASGRDLAVTDLWAISLKRSRQRRQLQAIGRKHGPRRKGISVAAGAAMVASPGTSALAVTGGGDRDAETDEPTTSTFTARSAPTTKLLSYGDVGPGVASVQRELRVDDDGIFGPITRGAVRDFQRASDLPVTGMVDTGTWAELFESSVLFYDAPGSKAPASASAATAPKTQLYVAPQAQDARARADATVQGGEADVATPGLAPEERHGGSPADLEEEVAKDGGPGTMPQVDAPAVQRDADPVAVAPVAQRSAPQRLPVADSAPQTTPVGAAPVAGGDGCSDGRLTSPVQGTQTSGFGENRGSHRHAGMDIAAPSGTRVSAAQCGVVTQAGAQGAYGNLVCVRHGGGIATCYAHLSRVATTVDQYVRRGELIGEVGCTGRCTGPHVHFEVRRGSQPTDPAPYLTGAQGVPAIASTARAASVRADGLAPAVSIVRERAAQKPLEPAAVQVPGVVA